MGIVLPDFVDKLEDYPSTFWDGVRTQRAVLQAQLLYLTWAQAFKNKKITKLVFGRSQQGSSYCNKDPYDWHFERGWLRGELVRGGSTKKLKGQGSAGGPFSFAVRAELVAGETLTEKELNELLAVERAARKLAAGSDLRSKGALGLGTKFQENISGQGFSLGRESFQKEIDNLLPQDWGGRRRAGREQKKIWDGEGAWASGKEGAVKSPRKKL